MTASLLPTASATAGKMPVLEQALKTLRIGGDGFHTPFFPLTGGPTYVTKDTFGNIVSQAGTPLSQQPYTFTGRDIDPLTGLYNLRAREYDAQTGRFTQADPAGGINLYSYVYNNPLDFIDPLGLDAEVFFLGPIFPLLSNRTSVFGHVAVRVNGEVYSYDSHGVHPLSTEDFLARERAQRNIVGFELSTTKEQDAAIRAFFLAKLKEHPRYNVLTENTCSGLSKRALEHAKIPVFEPIPFPSATTPEQLMADLLRDPEVQGVTVYPQFSGQPFPSDPFEGAYSQQR